MRKNFASAKLLSTSRVLEVADPENGRKLDSEEEIKQFTKGKKFDEYFFEKQGAIMAIHGKWFLSTSYVIETEDFQGWTQLRE